MNALTVNVLGEPIPQGSKVANRFGQGVRDDNAATLKPWRKLVDARLVEAIRYAGWTTLDEPTEVVLSFFHARPKSHFGTGRNATVLKPNAPVWKATRPDADKLTRAVLDALTTSRAVHDDSRVARLIVEDLWADAAEGVRITIRSLVGVDPATAAVRRSASSQEAVA